MVATFDTDLFRRYTSVTVNKITATFIYDRDAGDDGVSGPQCDIGNGPFCQDDCEVCKGCDCGCHEIMEDDGE